MAVCRFPSHVDFRVPCAEDHSALHNAYNISRGICHCVSLRHPTLERRSVLQHDVRGTGLVEGLSARDTLPKGVHPGWHTGGAPTKPVPAGYPLSVPCADGQEQCSMAPASEASVPCRLQVSISRHVGHVAARSAQTRPVAHGSTCQASSSASLHVLVGGKGP